MRKSAGEIWEDPTLEEWPENDFRIFCGDLGNEVTDEILSNAFRKYSSFQKGRVIRDKRTGKSRGYGFISFSNTDDYIKVMREMDGKYVGNRPIRLKRSTWKDRSLMHSTSQIDNCKYKKTKTRIRQKILINNAMGMNQMPMSNVMPQIHQQSNAIYGQQMYMQPQQQIYHNNQQYGQPQRYEEKSHQKEDNNIMAKFPNNYKPDSKPNKPVRHNIIYKN